MIDEEMTLSELRRHAKSLVQLMTEEQVHRMVQ